MEEFIPRQGSTRVSTPSPGPLSPGASDWGRLRDETIDRPVSIREKVHQLVRDMFFAGHYLPGYRVNESRLAAELGVSRTPVREALHLLENEGLLESIPRVGYQVREASWEEMEEICVIRAANEALAVRWAADRISTPTLGRLNQVLEEADAILERPETGLFANLDTEFHELIACAGGSERLLELCQTLRRHMLVFRLQSFEREANMRLAQRGHRAILKQLETGSAEGAELALLNHLEDARKSMAALTPREGR